MSFAARSSRQSVAQLMRLLNDTRRNNRIYVRLLTGTPGAVVKGEAMTALPPSVLSIMESERNGGSFSPIRSATIGEWELVMDSAISGSRLLTIDGQSMGGDAAAVQPLPFSATVHIMRKSFIGRVAPGAYLAIPSRPDRRCSLVSRDPVFWSVATQAEFLKGDVEDLSIDSDGRVFLGPSPALLAETAGPVPVDGAGAARRHARSRDPGTKARC